MQILKTIKNELGCEHDLIARPLDAEPFDDCIDCDFRGLDCEKLGYLKLCLSQKSHFVPHKNSENALAK